MISATFKKLSLEADAGCGYDSVTLYDGSSASSRQIAKVCTDAPSKISSSGSSLLVVFESDCVINAGQFLLSWKFVSEDDIDQRSYYHKHRSTIEHHLLLSHVYAMRSVSLKILSTAAQLYEKSHKRRVEAAE